MADVLRQQRYKPQGGGGGGGGGVCVLACGFPPSTYLDVHLGPLQEAQGGVSGAVRAQRNQLLQLLQVEPQLGTSVDDKYTGVQELRTRGSPVWHDVAGRGGGIHVARGHCDKVLSMSSFTSVSLLVWVARPERSLFRGNRKAELGWLNMRGICGQSQCRTPPFSFFKTEDSTT